MVLHGVAWVAYSSVGDVQAAHAYRCPYCIQVKKKLEEVKAKKEASNPDDYLPDGIDR